MLQRYVHDLNVSVYTTMNLFIVKVSTKELYCLTMQVSYTELNRVTE